MDIKQGLEYRTKRLEKYNSLGEHKYDYATNGILIRCLPKILFKGNSILVTFLQLLDVRIIMLLKYCDKLKKFKCITSYN